VDAELQHQPQSAASSIAPLAKMPVDVETELQYQPQLAASSVALLAKMPAGNEAAATPLPKAEAR
jgi:hypothetical protein